MKKISTVVTNTSRIVVRGKCQLCSIIQCGGGDVSNVQLYDGYVSDFTQRYSAIHPDGQTFAINYNQPIFFERGIYVQVNAVTTTVTISYSIYDEEDDI